MPHFYLSVLIPSRLSLIISFKIFLFTHLFIYLHFYRGFVVESCIVVQHVSRGADNGNSDPPVAKRPCPEVPVNAVNHTTKIMIHNLTCNLYNVPVIKLTVSRYYNSGAPS